MQVDKPFDLAKQADYISALQKYWSPDLDFAKRKLPVLHAPIFSNPVESDDPTVRGDDIPDGYETFDKYKLFVVAVTISEHAYQGSFHVELRPRGVPGVVVNKVSFLRRGSPANCAACREREASGSLVRSTMILNSADIASVIHDKGLNREDAGDEEIVQLLKDTFEAKIVAPDGTVLAETQHRSERGSSLKPLESGIPELTFYSASAAHPKDDVNRDIQFCEWKKHTTLCSGDWVDRR